VPCQPFSRLAAYLEHRRSKGRREVDCVQQRHARTGRRHCHDGGVIVGTSSPDILARTPAGRRGLWFVSRPDAALLQTLATDIAAGSLAATVSEVVGFNDIPDAIERNRTEARVGKVVADFSR